MKNYFDRKASAPPSEDDIGPFEPNQKPVHRGVYKARIVKPDGSPASPWAWAFWSGAQWGSLAGTKEGAAFYPLFWTAHQSKEWYGRARP